MRKKVRTLISVLLSKQEKRKEKRANTSLVPRGNSDFSGAPRINKDREEFTHNRQNVAQVRQSSDLNWHARLHRAQSELHLSGRHRFDGTCGAALRLSDVTIVGASAL
jgi:hypothetical protein